MNPQIGAMMQNPQMRAMFSNPEFLRTLSNPSTMQVTVVALKGLYLDILRILDRFIIHLSITVS